MATALRIVLDVTSKGSQDPENDLARRADAAWALLQDGNSRFIAERPWYRRDVTAARATAATQHPEAAVLACVDSRLVAESLFDCDFGQLVVARTAGQVTDEATIGSLEFAVNQLSVPLVVVLGHENCGAIALALTASREGTAGDAYLTRRLEPSAMHGLENAPHDPAGAAMRHQVGSTVAQLRERPAFAGARVIGAHYGLASGQVHPL